MSSPSSGAAHEVRSVRLLSASRDRVFAAWTDPEQLARWWGPKGFTNTFHAFELRPEGLWDFTMHGPNNTGFRNTCLFKRIEPPGYLEFDHLKEMHFYKAMVTLTGTPEGTRIEWTMRFDTVEELAPIRAFIELANEENLDKLEALLLHMK
ncbi:MAG: SRPBCC domain-containing protein [Flavobacteriales bacterium]|nr:SRPBCC domain-containing protein [Flavobacteriales bacterium]MBK9288819.1 SRPBCC domain-containing protein [Flavobacteriales bacterium]MBL0035645.1 SRPBCC domain-containing protein [Flavobacteriales bacterium]